MKRTKKQVLNMITVGYLLLSTVVMSGAVFAETVPSEEINTTTSSSAPKESLSSTMPTIPAPSTSSSEPIVSSEPKEEKKVLTYEDNQLLETVKADSTTPVVILQTKELEDGLTIQGTISAGREENQSETILSALTLQCQVETGDWEDTHRFSIGEAGVNLTGAEHPFEYSEGVEKTGEGNYRLAADYTIKYSDEDEQSQKGSLEIGRVIKVETQESTSTTQESTEGVQESTIESTQDSAEAPTKQSTVESSGPKEDPKQEEPIVIAPSASTGMTTPNTLGENNQIPKMADTYRDAFQRGLGIMPLAIRDAGYTFKNDFDESKKPEKARANFPKVYKATYTSKTTIDVEFMFDWSYRGHRRGGGTTGENDVKMVNDKMYSFFLHCNIFNQATNRWNTSGSNGNFSGQGELTIGKLIKEPGLGVIDIKSVVTNNRYIDTEYSNGFTNVWSHNQTLIKFEGIPTNKEVSIEYRVGIDTDYATYRTIFNFETANVVDLTNVSTPAFEATDGVTTSVAMMDGTYTGDISDISDDGSFLLSVDNGSTFFGHDKVNHDKDRSKKYYGRNIQYLGPGTKYYGKVSLKDWLGTTSKSSAAKEFYTPNSVNQPLRKALSIPTTASNATATFEGSYVVGAIPAHPKSVGIEISYDNLNWMDWTPTTSYSIDEGTKTVTYELKWLKAYTVFYTRFRVKNESGKWSSPSTATPFTTRGVALNVSTPTVDQANVTTNQITMNSGTYTGHVSTNSADVNSGYIRLSNNSGLNWYKYIDNLHHKSILDGTYEGSLLKSLETGTTYQVQVGLKDDNRAFNFSKSGTFYTLNSVSKPVVASPLPTPTGKNNASANISGVYGIGPAGTTPAHPDRVEVQISMDGGSTWQNVNGSTTPKLDSQLIDESSTKANFTISKMKAETNYHVRYRVKNGDPNEATFGWSAWSSTSDEFKTPKAPANMEIIDAPKLDFGMLKNENFSQTATLDVASQKNHVEVENSILTKGWKLTAKLDQLKRTDNPSILMPWATLKMDINLQNSIDDGLNWSDYATGVSGSPRIVTIESGKPAIPLWSISNPNHAQGYFRTEIDWTKVTLDVPANQTGMYAGNLVWSLDDTP